MSRYPMRRTRLQSLPFRKMKKKSSRGFFLLFLLVACCCWFWFDVKNAVGLLFESNPTVGFL